MEKRHVEGEHLFHGTYIFYHQNMVLESQVSLSVDLEEPADFENAIVAVKWGKFHLLVYAISITSGWSSMFETTTMSYVFPAAECDLSLNLEDKGLLNAVTYIGKSKNTMNFALRCSINIPQTFSHICQSPRLRVTGCWNIHTRLEKHTRRKKDVLKVSRYDFDRILLGLPIGHSG